MTRDPLLPQDRQHRVAFCRSACGPGCTEIGHTTGVLGVAALSGLVDVDAATLSMGNLVPGTLSVSVAAASIVIAVASNTVGKVAYAVSLGGISYGTAYGGLALSSLIPGAIVLWLRMSVT